MTALRFPNGSRIEGWPEAADLECAAWEACGGHGDGPWTYDRLVRYEVGRRLDEAIRSFAALLRESVWW